MLTELRAGFSLSHILRIRRKDMEPWEVRKFPFPTRKNSKIRATNELVHIGKNARLVFDYRCLQIRWKY